MATRPDKMTMFLEMAATVAKQSTCPRASVGAVIVRDRRIISMGYNGAPPGMPHCLDIGCETQDGLKMKEIYGVTVVLDPKCDPDQPTYIPYSPGCERTIHAEANALLWAARAGIATNESEMFCTHAPCYTCAKAMISAGIVRVHYSTEYRDTRGVKLLDKANVEVLSYAP